MKKGSRFLGIDDGAHEFEKLIGVAYRGTEFMEQVEIIDQEPDTGDATEKIIDLYGLFRQEIHAIILDGVSFNGFNIADIDEISERTERPVIAVTSNEPDRGSMKAGLESLDLDPYIIERLPEINQFDGLYVQFSGCTKDQAKEMIALSTRQGNIPEAVRASDLIGSGLNQH